MRHSGLFHLHFSAEFANRTRSGPQAGQDSDPTRRREGTHETSHLLRGGLREKSCDS